MPEINVKIGSKKDFEELATLDYTNTYKKMFDISYKEGIISISEIDLPQPITNESKNYTDEIVEDMIEKKKDNEFVPLVVFYKNSPAGYLMAKWENWSNGRIFVIDGILVANQYARKGLAKALITKCIEIASNDKECRGVYAEMDTTKYQANKLLLKMGFKFGGSKFFIYSKKEPHKYSKEAIYFYYPL